MMTAHLDVKVLRSCDAWNRVDQRIVITVPHEEGRIATVSILIMASSLLYYEVNIKDVD